MHDTTANLYSSSSPSGVRKPLTIQRLGVQATFPNTPVIRKDMARNITGIDVKGIPAFKSHRLLFAHSNTIGVNKMTHQSVNVCSIDVMRINADISAIHIYTFTSRCDDM
jgi:hypothetical protein